MNETLIKELKNEMKYSEVRCTCGNCHYHQEVSMGEHQCQYNKIAHFPVRTEGCCKFHKPVHYIGESQ